MAFEKLISSLKLYLTMTFISALNFKSLAVKPIASFRRASSETIFLPSCIIQAYIFKIMHIKVLGARLNSLYILANGHSASCLYIESQPIDMSSRNQACFLNMEQQPVTMSTRIQARPHITMSPSITCSITLISGAFVSGQKKYVALSNSFSRYF